MITPSRVYAVVLSGSLLWCGLVLLAPTLGTESGGFLYTFFHRICHQFDGHSLHIGGEPLAVCARCTAIYFSFPVGVLVYPLFRRVDSVSLPSRWLLAMIVLPMVLDVAGGMTGLHGVTLLTRLLTGSLFGGVIAWFIIPIAVGASSHIYPSPSLLKKGPHDV
jgi:uncharacterized membrane protein